MSNRAEIISRDDLQEMIDKNVDFTLVEVLPEDSFRSGHIPGAIHIPGDGLRAQAPEKIPNKDHTIVVYCASPACTASDKAAALLTEMGYTDVRDYRGGKEHWHEGGLGLTREQMATA